MKLKLLIFIVLTITSSFLLNAQTSTPQSPEAFSFEPVDATDMVSINTGDFTYVVPLLNIPSPEGGYPITLAYHAGIAMDQEASWVGLGWNINPGAVTRSINGYPDDWNAGSYYEYFYDEGNSTSTFSISLGVTNIETGFSVGLSASWSDNRSFSVNAYGNYGTGLNIGGSIGTSGVSASASVGLGKSPFSISANVGTNGYGFGVSFNPTISDKPITTKAISTTTTQTSYHARISYSMNKSWGGEVSSSVGIGIAISKTTTTGVDFGGDQLKSSLSGSKYSRVGTGINFSLSTSVSQNDYTVNKSGWYVPIIIPTGTDWLITGGFGRQTIEYHLNEEKINQVSGPLYYDKVGNEIVIGSSQWYCVCTSSQGGGAIPINDPSECQSGGGCSPVLVNDNVIKNDAFMDINEIGIISGDKKLNLSKNNMVLPNYDNYRIASQGLSGTFSPRLNNNGALFGLSKEINENNKPFNLKYNLPDLNSTLSNFTNFSGKVNYYFDNEYSTSLIINPVNFNNVQNNYGAIYNYLDTISSNATIHPRKRNSRFIEYFTQLDFFDTNTGNYNIVYPNGFIKTNESFNYNLSFGLDGIVAFKITAADGKVYHYSLPVYNHEIVSRTFGIVHDRPNENQGFFEKRQLKPYATHWLLTAVTGPDFIDMNNNNIVDEEDYGYWVKFDYGKWSDGYIWYNPYYGETKEDETDPIQKSYNFGRKDIYYLDKISTRTHTALFIKDIRLDAKGKLKNYTHRWGTGSNFENFNFKSQQILKLNEIILLKNEDLNSLNFTLNNINESDLVSSPNPNFTNTIQWHSKESSIINTKTINYSLQNNVLDVNDLSQNDWATLKDKARKIVRMNYTYSLAKNTPYSSSGRLTLKSLSLLGKSGVQLLPTYQFNYMRNFDFDWDKKDDWGFYDGHPDNWSLSEIKNPTGGKIQVKYEADEYFSAFNHAIVFSNEGDDKNKISGGTGDYLISSTEDLGINIGDELDVEYYLAYYYDGDYSCNGPCGPDEVGSETQSGIVVVAEDLSDGVNFKYRLTTPNLNDIETDIPQIYDYITTTISATYKVDHSLKGGGIKVSEIITTDNSSTYKTVYDYSDFSSGLTSGKVSYIPYSQKADTEVPYGAEMPTPIVMYGNVEVTNYGQNNLPNGNTKYRFKTIDDKEDNIIKFGNDFEIIENDLGTNSNTGKEVNIKELIIKDNYASLGHMIETSTFNNEGQLLYRLKNKYKTADEIYNASIIQGVIQESFQSYKEVDYVDTNFQDKWLINSSTKISYPSVIESTTITQGSYNSTTYFDKYDFKTGHLLETRTYASDGTAFKTKTVPAYTKYPQMGSKVDNINNKNMLSQQAVNYTYLLNETTNVEKVISANITTWNNDWIYRDYDGRETSPTQDNEKIWRKHKNYIWEGQVDLSDGTYVGFNQNTDDGFDWGLGVTTQNNPKWKNVSTTTRFDHFSMPLEILDINGNYASTKMGDNNSKVLTVANAKYTEQYYSGAEYTIGNTGYFDGEVKATGRIPDNNAHTGNYIVSINTGENAFEVNIPSNEERIDIKQQFKVSVWVQKGMENNAMIKVGTSSVNFNTSETQTAGNWSLLNGYISIPTSQTIVSIEAVGGALKLDDFRLHPISSSMTSYVYNEWDELWYIIGANGLATKFEYDAAGRLIKTYTEIVDDTGVLSGFIKVSENRYNYKKQ